jgi:hypothetical protein
VNRRLFLTHGLSLGAALSLPNVVEACGRWHRRRRICSSCELQRWSTTDADPVMRRMDGFITVTEPYKAGDVSFVYFAYRVKVGISDMTNLRRAYAVAQRDSWYPQHGVNFTIEKEKEFHQKDHPHSFFLGYTAYPLQPDGNGAWVVVSPVLKDSSGNCCWSQLHYSNDTWENPPHGPREVNWNLNGFSVGFSYKEDDARGLYYTFLPPRH